METNNEIFRKKSLERVNSPEQLNDYIKVSNPGVWVVLAAVVLLLVGVGVWSVFGTLSTVVELPATVENGTAVCYASAEEAKKLSVGMEADIGDVKGTVVSIPKTPVKIDDSFDSYALYLGGLSAGDWVFPVSIGVDAPDGTYTVTVVTERITPISFVLN